MMLKPQDVFRDYVTFKEWWWSVRVKDGVVASAAVLWCDNYPCVPGSYGISIE